MSAAPRYYGELCMCCMSEYTKPDIYNNQGHMAGYGTLFVLRLDTPDHSFVSCCPADRRGSIYQP